MSSAPQLWVDKYRPKHLTKVDFAKEQAQHLKNLVECGDFPHLLFYGPSGGGKKTRVMCLLRELYGPGVERLRVEQMTFTAPSDKKVTIHAIKSNYHIEVNPSDAKFYDRVVVMELIKNVAQSYQLDANSQREFKVVVITGAEMLSKDAQHALRRTMEKYTATCRLILIANSCSQLIPAILSRCLAIRVPLPSVEDICTILQDVARKENLTIDAQLSARIATEANRNLRRALLILQSCHVRANSNTIANTVQITQPDWRVCIGRVVQTITGEQTPATLLRVRTDLYELLVHNIPTDVIMKCLLSELLRVCDSEIKAHVASMATFYEARMLGSNKEIFHLEAFIAAFVHIYKGYMNQLGGRDEFFDDFSEDM